MGIADNSLAEVSRFAFADADAAIGVESVVYTPISGGSARTFNAQVFREPPMDVPELSGMRTPTIRIFCPYSSTATQGITAAMPGDKVSVATVRGGTATSKTVTTVISADAGGFFLDLGN